MSIELAFAQLLEQQLKEIEDDAVSKLPSGLPDREYNQSCGYIEAIRQVRALIPELSDELQRR